MLKSVFVFSGLKNTHPAAVFTEVELARKWIKEHGLWGTLTEYPIDVPAYDWAIGKGRFKPAGDHERSGDFIGNFSHMSQKHYHFEDGFCGVLDDPDLTAG
jgi:hypothetical protein